MKNIFSLYKPVGMTPLQSILQLKENRPEYEKEKLSYAGRLDPMADGLLLILVGDENKKRQQYEQLEKEYVFSVLFGLRSDSYDLLGIPRLQKNAPLAKAEMSALAMYLPTCVGTFSQPFPPFSSKNVRGKPLYYWAREKKLDSITIPSKTISIFSLRKESETVLFAKDVLKRITTILPSINGRFRQEEILSSWNSLLKDNNHGQFSLITFSLSCSSGTYVRTIANQLGEYLKTGALAFSITRMRVGPFTIDDCITYN